MMSEIDISLPPMLASKSDSSCNPTTQGSRNRKVFSVSETAQAALRGADQPRLDLGPALLKTSDGLRWALELTRARS
jgi:hypothetical protein